MAQYLGLTFGGGTIYRRWEIFVKYIYFDIPLLKMGKILFF
jgi:hypothetical protein